jgi:glycosyltransferase involved in cell wall biosynthesis
MRAYAETLVEDLTAHAADIEVELVELDPDPATSRWSSRVSSLALPWRAWRQRRRKTDVWHVLDGSRAYVAQALTTAPRVITAHDIIPVLQSRGHFPSAPPVGQAARILWHQNARAIRDAGRVVCDSSCTERDLAQEMQLPAARACVAHLPLRSALRALAAESRAASRGRGLILHVGTNGFYKNREGALRIFSRLDPDLARSLVLAGPPPSAALRELANALGIESRVEWSVDPDDERLAEHYLCADALLFPSMYEGFGWPALEAMNFGLPVVASDSGSLPEVVGSGGFSLPVDDDAGFVATLERLLSSREQREEWTSRGKQQARRFDGGLFARAMRDAYFEAANAGAVA